MTVSFYFIRHGQTDWNKEKRIQGHSNIPLNEKGREQALELALKLKEIHFDQCISSDLDRAFETAQIVLKGRDIQISKDQRLREAHFGEVEGMLVSEIIERFGQERWDASFHGYQKESLDLSFPGGETRREALERVDQVVDKLLIGGDQNILISTHGGVVANYLSYKAKLAERMRVSNCSCYKLSSQNDLWSVEGPL